MKKQFQPWWLLSALAFVLSAGIALNAQQTAPQGQSPNQQAQPSAPPTAQQPAPPTSDEPAPPPTAQSAQPQTGNQPAPPPDASPESGQNGNSAAPPQTQTPATPNSGTTDQAAPPTPPPSAGAAGQSAQQPNGAQVFSGTVVKEGDRYMLHDEASGQTYDVDHQDEVQKYAGKRVRVHGMLDPTGKMIHLQ